MTGRDEENQTPRRPGGHAAERRRQFQQQRGLSDPLELPEDEVSEDEVSEDEVSEDEPDVPAQPDQDGSPDCEHD
jgi:hypothetical protein